MIFTATILRSNPHIIREIYINDEKNMQDLFRVLEVCLNWEKDSIGVNSFITIKRMLDEHSETTADGTFDMNSVESMNSVKSIDSEEKFPEIPVKKIYKENCEAFFQTYPEIYLSFPMAEMSEQRMMSQNRWNNRPYNGYGQNNYDQNSYGQRTHFGQNGYRNEIASRQEPEQWEIKLTMLPEENYRIQEDSIDHPDAYLIRHRGLQPIQEASSMKDNNSIHQEMLYKNFSYIFGLGEYYKEDYLVKTEEIYQRLQNPDQRKTVWKADPSVCQDLKQMLDGFKLDELKYTIRNQKLPIDTNCRKDILISRIEQYYNRVEFWKKILDSLMLKEYTLLKQTCFSNLAEKPIIRYGDFPILEEYCLFRHSFHQPATFALPLVKYLESYLTEYGDEDLIYRKKWQQVLQVASILYVVFDKKMCQDLARIMFGEELDPEDLSMVWERTEHWVPYNSNLMYNPDYIYYKDAYELSQSEIWKSQRSYIPTRKEMQEILENGLNYEKKDQKKLEKMLQPLIGKHFWMQNTSSIFRYLYHLCRCDVDREEIRSGLQDTLGIMGKKTDIDHFLEVVDELRSRVRRVEYRGFTQEEYENYH